MIKTKISFSSLILIAIASCSMPSTPTGLNTEVKLIKGRADFSEGVVEQKKIDFKTKASLSDLGNVAVVSLVTTADDLAPNQTMATGLTDSAGNFAINIGFSPINNKVYILDATKRIGGSGEDSISVRTYIRWNGSIWEGIASPVNNINTKTTAITIIDRYNSTISADETIGKVINGTTSNIGSVTSATIDSVAGIVSGIINSNRDPIRFVGYQNSKYYILKENTFNKIFLFAKKECPNCILTNENLSNQDFSNGDLNNSDLTNANLSNTNLSQVNLENSNLSGANLKGANLSNASFTGAIWRNGITCLDGSLGNCVSLDLLVNDENTDNQKNTAIAMDFDGDFVVTWQSDKQNLNGYEIYARRYTSNGVASGSEFQVNTYLTGSQTNPSVALDAEGNFVITWESAAQDGSDYGIYAQRYTSTGTATGSEFRVNTTSTNSQTDPSVAMDADGDFIISWGSYNQDGSRYGIYAKRYTSSGTVIGSEFRVNTYTQESQRYPETAMQLNGSFVITWQSLEQDGNGYGVYAQRYSSTGLPNGSEFRVNSQTINNQSKPSIATDYDGDFVITWQSLEQDGSDYGIYSQRYSSAGLSNGSEFKNNTHTNSNQSHPRVAMDYDGDFVITWHSLGQDGNGLGVYSQRYSSVGLPNGSEFQLNSYTTNNQLKAVVAMDAEGDFVVNFLSAQSGNNYGVYIKNYDQYGLTK